MPHCSRDKLEVPAKVSFIHAVNFIVVDVIVAVAARSHVRPQRFAKFVHDRAEDRHEKPPS